jgi:N-acetylglutamate synthase-like GNAT family acetyltransferase
MAAPISGYRVRRATLDDVAALVELWDLMRFPGAELSKRITEFQVAQTAHNQIIGTVGLQMTERQGRIYGESFADFSHADSVRPLFWERLQSVATNNGLTRLWTQETAPFWNQSGMKKADPETLAKLPGAWKILGGDWRQLKLKDEIEAVISMDKEFMLFMQSEKEQSQKALQRAKALKVVASIVAVVVLFLVLGAAFWLFIKNPGVLRR